MEMGEQGSFLKKKKKKISWHMLKHYWEITFMQKVKLNIELYLSILKSESQSSQEINRRYGVEKKSFY